ncbi:MAG: NAD-dependent epimerase/dehydratase family protein, partial [Microbacterium sp.]|nr:NAD-dependent epimerase/dehydratase family protein [Microbacterium sp.]
MTGRVVIGGSSGFMGRHLAAHHRAAGREVVTISRSGADLTWADQTGIDAAVDGAALVIGLAGKSVNCRYTPENRAEIFASRLDTTAALGRAIARAAAPPALWVNSSTATIYRHAEDRPMTEATGELGTGFSVEVAKAWERALFADPLPTTRRVALRSAIVLGDGGVLEPLRGLAAIGLGGAQHDGPWPVGRRRRDAGTAHFPGAPAGRQRFSWVHVDDVVGIIDFLEEHPELAGPVNAAAPNPVDNAEFMATVRRVLGVRFGPPMPRWMLELGAIGIRT